MADNFSSWFGGVNNISSGLQSNQPGIPQTILNNLGIPGLTASPFQTAQVNISSPGQSAIANANSGNGQKYDFKNMRYEQSAKQTNPLLRFTLKVGTGPMFQGHIDPYHISNEQNKRLVEIQVNTGIIIQDFGYMAQQLELRGTTGAAFYTEIKAMDAIFNSQSINGTPTNSILVIENRSYTGVWKSFFWERQAQKNTYDYTIGFTVLQLGVTGSVAVLNSPIVQQAKAAISQQSSSGQLQTSNVPAAGISPRQYLISLGPGVVPASQFGASGAGGWGALGWLGNNWDSTGNNGPYPGDDSPLGYIPIGSVPGFASNTYYSEASIPQQYLTVPVSWSAALLVSSPGYGGSPL